MSIMAKCKFNNNNGMMEGSRKKYKREKGNFLKKLPFSAK